MKILLITIAQTKIAVTSIIDWSCCPYGTVTHYDVSCLLPVCLFHFRCSDNEWSLFSTVILLQLSCAPSLQPCGG